MGGGWDTTHLVVEDPLDQHQAPGDQQSLQGIRKSMGLISPGDIG